MLEKEYILNSIRLIDSNTISIDKLADVLCNQICLQRHSYKTDDLVKAIKDILTKYSNKEISSDNVIQLIEEIKVQPVQVFNKPTPKKEEIIPNNTDVTDDIVDLDTDTIQEAAANLDNFENEIANTELTVPTPVVNYSQGVSETAKRAKYEISMLLDGLKESMVTTLESVEDIDHENGVFNLNTASFSKIAELSYNIGLNSRARKATIDFFRKGGCTIQGNMAVLKLNGKTYTYDMQHNKFYVNNKEAFEAYFYVPEKATNYSSLNTYTFFTTSQPQFKDVIDSRNTNSVVVKIVKPKTQFNKFNEVADITKFTNAIAKTDLSTCKNVIGGDSVYGAYSLQIAAKNGNLYDTVYCVNNAALVTGVNAAKGEKAQFSSLDELKGLNGKNIYFVSSAGDENLSSHYGSKGAMTGCSYDQSYTYTGLKILIDNLPDANIHMVYKPSNKSQTQLSNLLSVLDSRYRNFTYEIYSWDDYARKRYTTHTQGQALIADLAEAPATNANINHRA